MFTVEQRDALRERMLRLAPETLAGLEQTHVGVARAPHYAERSSPRVSPFSRRARKPMCRTWTSLPSGSPSAVADPPDVSEPRYRAVQASGRRHSLLKAAIEDAEQGQVIQVSDAHMAFYLADLLNDLDAGKPGPPAGEQHHPVRFQLTHDATGLSRVAAVVYIHGNSARVVAAADTDDAAKTIARLLNQVDYPMIDGWPVAKTGMIVPTPEELPEPSLRPAHALRPRRGGPR